MKRALLLVSMMLAPACGDDKLAPPPSPIPVQLTLWNRSQFEIIDARLHGDAAYASAPNLLAEPLPVEAQIVVTADTGTYVTVIRRKVEVGDTIALTTARRLDDIEDGSTLVVFDEAFRLMPPP